MNREVCSDVKAPVENDEITTAHTIAGHHALSQRMLGHTHGTHRHGNSSHSKTIYSSR